MKFLAMLFIVSGFLTLYTGEVNIALGVSKYVEGIYNYIISIPLILIGIITLIYGKKEY